MKARGTFTEAGLTLLVGADTFDRAAETLTVADIGNEASIFQLPGFADEASVLQMRIEMDRPSIGPGAEAGTLRQLSQGAQYFYHRLRRLQPTRVHFDNFIRGWSAAGASVVSFLVPDLSGSSRVMMEKNFPVPFRGLAGLVGQTRFSRQREKGHGFEGNQQAQRFALANALYGGMDFVAGMLSGAKIFPDIEDSRL